MDSFVLEVHVFGSGVFDSLLCPAASDDGVEPGIEKQYQHASTDADPARS
jgi:hypothetical protein